MHSISTQLFLLLIFSLLSPALTQSINHEIDSAVHDDEGNEKDLAQQRQSGSQMPAVALENMMELINARMVTLESKMEAVESKIGPLENKMVTMESGLTSTNEVEELEDVFSNLQSGYESALDRMIQFFKSVNASMAEITGRISNLEQDVRLSNEKLRLMESDVDQGIQRLQKSIDDISSRTDTLERDIAAHFESSNRNEDAANIAREQLALRIRNLHSDGDIRNTHLESLNASLLTTCERINATVVNISNWVTNHDSEVDLHRYFKCGDGPSIPLNQRCNLVPDCADGSDEENCSHILCNNGTAIPITRRCNLRPDCPDGADEQDCDRIMCNDGAAVSLTKRCDLKPDCLDGADEQDCKSFKCSNGKIIPHNQRCNLVSDCSDEADELNCSCISNQMGDLSTAQYDQFASLKSLPVDGRTFNGSTLLSISDRVPSLDGMPDTLTMEFANRLDSTMSSCLLHDPQNTTYHPAPTLIGANTKEVFSFFETEWGRHPYITYSCVVPGTNLRLAVFGKCGNRRVVGLAFVSESMSMQQYFKDYKSYGKNIFREGPTKWQWEPIAVKHNNYLAKATLKDLRRTIIKVEVVQIPFCSRTNFTSLKDSSGCSLVEPSS